MEIRKIDKDEKLTTITLTTEEVSKITSILQATPQEKDTLYHQLYFNLQVVNMLLQKNTSLQVKCIKGSGRILYLPIGRRWNKRCNHSCC